ncbi:hypothetical protein MNBD_ALPHA06-1302 [hydrothermal vent metagenome]|uniref:Uncharacterized protein n=1 Tax=hydrothermal vent metagenome TaxID=652676 RepID=A0A3B0RLC4_9ZZZZ
MNKQISKAQFQHWLGIYGADFSKWPQHLMQAASKFAEQNPQEFAGEIGEELALDQLLSSITGPQISSGLRSNILNSFSQEQFSFMQLLTSIFGRNNTPPGLALASMLVLALCGGLVGFVGFELFMGPGVSAEMMFETVMEQSFGLDTEIET